MMNRTFKKSVQALSMAALCAAVGLVSAVEPIHEDELGTVHLESDVDVMNVYGATAAGVTIDLEGEGPMSPALEEEKDKEPVSNDIPPVVADQNDKDKKAFTPDINTRIDGQANQSSPTISTAEGTRSTSGAAGNSGFSRNPGLISNESVRESPDRLRVVTDAQVRQVYINDMKGVGERNSGDITINNLSTQTTVVIQGR